MTLEVRVPPTFEMFLDYQTVSESPSHSEQGANSGGHVSDSIERRTGYVGNVHASDGDSLMSNVPMNVYDRNPLFPMFNMSIKILVWNIKGVSNKVAGIRELIRINDPSVLALVETHMSGEQAQRICDSGSVACGGSGI